MLCPKCGFISFDHLSACVKCHNDLSQIGAELHGTATDAACRDFLGVVLMNASAPQENPSELEEVSIAIDLPLAQEEKDDNAGEALTGAGPDFGAEEAAAAVPDEESPALEFDLEEMPPLDLSDFEPAPGAEKSMAAEVTAEVPETTSFDLDVEGDDERGEELLPPPSMTMESPADDKPEISGDSLTIDTSSLTLDSVDSPLDGGPEEEVVLESSPPTTEDESSGQLTIDLNEIDLSDLVHDQIDTSPSRDQAAPAGEENGLDFEDTMDLSLFVGDLHDGSAPPATFSNDTGVEPIDLTLMDEALVELSVDPGRKEPSFEKEAPAGELELSMEDGPK